MHIEYWICDGCKEKIENDEKLKYGTPEIGYPFIDKKTGKHYHYECLLTHYKRSKRLKGSEFVELVNDAIDRHNKHFDEKLRIGRLNQKTVVVKKGTKKQRESLVNYFYNYYGIRNLPTNLGKIIDDLNTGEPKGKYANIMIPYPKLKEMFLYYRKELDKIFKSKVDKGDNMNPTGRIAYDIAFLVGNLDSYDNRKESLYNQLQNNKINGEDAEKTIDASKFIGKNTPKKKQDFEKINELHELSDELGKVD